MICSCCESDKVKSHIAPDDLHMLDGAIIYIEAMPFFTCSDCGISFFNHEGEKVREEAVKRFYKEKNIK